MNEETTKYRNPMTEQELNEMVQYLASQMDDEQVLTEEALTFLENQDLTPTEEDQETIMHMLEEQFHASKEEDQSNSGNVAEEEGSSCEAESGEEASNPVAEASDETTTVESEA